MLTVKPFAANCDPQHSWHPISGYHLTVAREHGGLLMHLADPSVSFMPMRLVTCLQLAGALKLWLECLPEPLISPDLARILVQATRCLDEQERLPIMQQVLCHVSANPWLCCCDVDVVPKYNIILSTILHPWCLKACSVAYNTTGFVWTWRFLRTRSLTGKCSHR